MHDHDNPMTTISNTPNTYKSQGHFVVTQSSICHTLLLKPSTSPLLLVTDKNSENIGPQDSQQSPNQSVDKIHHNPSVSFNSASHPLLAMPINELIRSIHSVEPHVLNANCTGGEGGQHLQNPISISKMVDNHSI